MTEECGLPKPGVTPLMCPANESTETIEALLRDNPAVDAADASGWTALMYAAYSSSDFVLDRLLTAGANPKARSAGRQTVLMAVISGYKQTRHKIEQLVSAGADINAADIEGRTALMFAVQRFWLPDLTAWLLDAGARTRIKDAKGKSAFDYLEAAFAENKQESAAHARVLELLSNARP